MHGRARVTEIDGIVGEEIAQALDQARVIVTEIDGPEAREEIEILGSPIVPQADVASPDEDAAVTEDAEQLHERGVDVARVLHHRRMRRGRHLRSPRGARPARASATPPPA